MQVLVGPTYNMEMSESASSTACVGDSSSSSSSGGGVPSETAQDNNNNSSNNNKAVSSSSCLFLNVDEDDVVVAQNTYGSDDDSSDSSSIGAPEEDDEEDDVVSSSKTGAGLTRNMFYMDSLEDSLPTKRGISNHYSGKSKSFVNLTEVMSMGTCTAIKDLEKDENPFNKRRRLLIANKWSRKFFYSRHNPKSMPLLPVLHDYVEEEEEDDEHLHGKLSSHKSCLDLEEEGD